MLKASQPCAGRVGDAAEQAFDANGNATSRTDFSGNTTGAKTEKDQKRMMGEIAKLLGSSEGKLDIKDYDRTVATLMSGGSDPVITKKPEGAYSSAVSDAMK